jgi:hypothetical protein
MAVDWNHYRKVVNTMRRYGMRQQARDVAALIRVASALERNDMPLAVERMMKEMPQKKIIIGGDVT